jgi:tetratricopeptide (TPR) repeat protein
MQMGMDDYEASDATLQRMLTLAETKMERPNPTVAEGLLALGALRAEQERFADAVEVYRRAAAEYEAMGRPDEPNMTTVIAGQAMALRSLGRLDEAGPLFVQTIDRGFEHAWVSPSERAVLRLGAADWLWSHPGQYEQARKRAVEQAELALRDAKEDQAFDTGEIEAARKWLKAHPR